jgi:hypothetical protein
MWIECVSKGDRDWLMRKLMMKRAQKRQYQRELVNAILKMGTQKMKMSAQIEF